MLCWVSVKSFCSDAKTSAAAGKQHWRKCQNSRRACFKKPEHGGGARAPGSCCRKKKKKKMEKLIQTSLAQSTAWQLPYVWRERSNASASAGGGAKSFTSKLMQYGGGNHHWWQFGSGCFFFFRAAGVESISCSLAGQAGSHVRIDSVCVQRQNPRLWPADTRELARTRPPTSACSPDPSLLTQESYSDIYYGDIIRC